MRPLLPDRSDLAAVLGLALFGAITGLLWNPQALRPRSVVLTTELDRPERASWLGSIESRELLEAMRAGRIVVVDARPRASYEAGHLPGSLPSMGEDAISYFRLLLKILDPSVPIAVIDDAGDGYGAKRLAGFFRARGFDRPLLLVGGVAGWRSAGLPLSKGWDFDPKIFEDQR